MTMPCKNEDITPYLTSDDFQAALKARLAERDASHVLAVAIDDFDDWLRNGVYIEDTAHYFRDRNDLTHYLTRVVYDDFRVDERAAFYRKRMFSEEGFADVMFGSGESFDGTEVYRADVLEYCLANEFVTSCADPKYAALKAYADRHANRKYVCCYTGGPTDPKTPDEPASSIIARAEAATPARCPSSHVPMTLHELVYHAFMMHGCPFQFVNRVALMKRLTSDDGDVRHRWASACSVDCGEVKRCSLCGGCGRGGWKSMHATPPREFLPRSL